MPTFMSARPGGQARRLPGPRHATALTIVALATLVLGGCLDPNPACADLPSDIELTLTADSLSPADPRVCRDSDVTLLVTSEVDGVFHIHGLDDIVSATPVAAGETVEIAFTARRSGQFPIEVHPADDPAGVNVGLLTVHEP
jgi:hypothetical protein